MIRSWRWAQRQTLHATDPRPWSANNADNTSDSSERAQFRLQKKERKNRLVPRIFTRVNSFQLFRSFIDVFIKRSIFNSSNRSRWRKWSSNCILTDPSNEYRVRGIWGGGNFVITTINLIIQTIIVYHPPRSQVDECKQPKRERISSIRQHLL